MLTRVVLLSLLLLALPAPAQAQPFGPCGEYPGPTTSVDAACYSWGRFCIAFALNRCIASGPTPVLA